MKRTTISLLGVFCVAVAVQGQANGRERASIGNGPAGASIPADVDLSLMEYYQVHSNGLVEYALNPTDGMTPAGTGLPRPAYVVAQSFLAANLASLSIHQDALDFTYLSTERRADGSERVLLEQRVSGIRVETSLLEFVVQGQRVKRVAGRLVWNPATLPSACDVQVPAGGELRYVPQTGQTIVIVVTIEGVVGVSQEKYTDPCSGAELGSKMLVK